MEDDKEFWEELKKPIRISEKELEEYFKILFKDKSVSEVINEGRED